MGEIMNDNGRRTANARPSRPTPIEGSKHDHGVGHDHQEPYRLTTGVLLMPRPNANGASFASRETVTCRRCSRPRDRIRQSRTEAPGSPNPNPARITPRALATLDPIHNGRLVPLVVPHSTGHRSTVEVTAR